MTLNQEQNYFVVRLLITAIFLPPSRQRIGHSFLWLCTAARRAGSVLRRGGGCEGTRRRLI